MQVNLSFGFGGGGAPPPGYPGGHQYAPGSPFGTPQPAVMSPEHFNALLDRTRRASFANQKLDEVRLAVNGGAVLTSEQARLLVREVKSDSEQQAAALALYPRVLDAWNFGDVLVEFTFRNSKEPVIKTILSTLQPLQSHQMSAGGPMDPVSFSHLAERLKKNCSFNNERVNEVRLAVHGRAFFSSTEIRAILQETNGDNEQVEIAVFLYPRCTDPAHFGDALTALKFQTSKAKVMGQVAKGPQPHVQQAQPSHQQPGYGAPQPVYSQQPGYGVPQQPGYGVPQQPGYGVPQQPGYGVPQQPGYGVPQQPGYGVPQPGYGQPYPQQPYPQQPYPQQPYPQQPYAQQSFPPQHSFSAPPSTTVAPQPMDAASFGQLKQRLSHGFASDKINEVRLCIKAGAWFSAAQGKEILTVISFDSDQYECAVALYPHIVDKQSFGQTLEAVKFSSTKDKIMKAIGH